MSAPDRARTPRWALAASAVAFLALPVLGEIALRHAGFRHPPLAERVRLWSPTHDVEIRSGRGLCEYDPHTLWRPRPGAVLPWTDGERVNPDGFRGPQISIERDPRVLRIAALGGSGTFGVGVRWQETYCARLVEILRERGIEAEVLCAGVPDYTITQGLERWRNDVLPFHPNVVVCTLVGNVSYRAAYGSMSDQQKLDLVRSLPDQGRPCRGWCSKLRVADLGRWLGDVWKGSYWAERESGFDEARIPGSDCDLDWPGVRRSSTVEYEQCLDALFDETLTARARLMLVSIPRDLATPPPRAFKVYEQALQRWTERRKVLYFDMRNEYLAAIQSEDVGRDDLITADGLPTECGHLQIAKCLAEEIASRVQAQRAR